MLTALASCLVLLAPGDPFPLNAAQDRPSADRAPATGSVDAAQREPDQRPPHTTTSLRGKVVWMAEALQRRFGIQSVHEVQQRLLALETAEGQLYPLVEDVRGRSFRRDERLRGIDVELLVRQYDGSPMVQVIRIYACKDDGKYELDYWCDICAIALFELVPCDCCQGPIELRERKVAGGGEG